LLREAHLPSGSLARLEAARANAASPTPATTLAAHVHGVVNDHVDDHGSDKRCEFYMPALRLTSLDDRALAPHMRAMSEAKPVPTKICARCGRPMTWRKKWAKVWAEVKYCSQRCRAEK